MNKTGNSEFAIKVNGEIYQRFDTFEQANKRAEEMVNGEHQGSNVQVIPLTNGLFHMVINGRVVFDKKEDIIYKSSFEYLERLRKTLLKSSKYKNSYIEIRKYGGQEWAYLASQNCKAIGSFLYYDDILKETLHDDHREDAEREYWDKLLNGDNVESKKNDRLDNKVRMELLPMDALEAVAKIYTFGAEKYGVGTWRQLPDGSERYRAALLRHMTAECKGEELDPESGLPHVFHEAWNALARVAIYLDNHKS